MTGEEKRNTLDIEELRIVDRNGKVRGLLRAGSGYGPSFELFDENGMQRISIGYDDKSASTRISIFHQKGFPLVGIGSTDDGRVGIQITDTKGTPAFLLGVHSTGQRHAEVLGESGVVWAL